jgi:hypothetical protein
MGDPMQNPRDLRFKMQHKQPQQSRATESRDIRLLPVEEHWKRMPRHQPQFPVIRPEYAESVAECMTVASLATCTRGVPNPNSCLSCMFVLHVCLASRATPGRTVSQPNGLCFYSFSLTAASAC